MPVVKPFDRQDFVVSSFPDRSNKHGQKKKRHLEKGCDERKKHDQKKQRRHLTILTEKRWDEKKNERENKMKINEVDKKMR